MNRNVLNISIIRVGSPTVFFNLVQFPHAKNRLIVASLWSRILHPKNSLTMVSFADAVLGLLRVLQSFGNLEFRDSGNLRILSNGKCIWARRFR